MSIHIYNIAFMYLARIEEGGKSTKNTKFTTSVLLSASLISVSSVGTVSGFALLADFQSYSARPVVRSLKLSLFSACVIKYDNLQKLWSVYIKPFCIISRWSVGIGVEQFSVSFVSEKDSSCFPCQH